jgi:hypothetical protein
LNIFILAASILSAVIAIYYLGMLLAVAFGKARFTGKWGHYTAMVIVAASASVSYWLLSLL